MLRSLFLAGIAIALAGCTQEAHLRSPDGQYIGKATVEFEDNDSGNITLERNGLVYRGPWSAHIVDESRKISGNHGIGSQKYLNYQRGWSSYLRAGQSTLQSSRGDILKCEFKYRATAVYGNCSSEAESFEFVTES